MNKQKRNLSEHILKALTYFEIFDFAPTIEELYRMMAIKIEKRELLEFIYSSDKFVLVDGYVSRKKKKHLVEIRKRGLSKADLQKRLGLKIGHKIGKVPGVKGVFLTGSVAAGSGNGTDDLDFFVISQKNRLWLIRLLLYFVTAILERKYSQHICINFILDINHLKLSFKNLYTATELMLMIPAYDEGVYQKVLSSNPWLWEYKPNASPKKKKINKPSIIKQIIERVMEFPIFEFLDILEMKRANISMQRHNPGPEVIARRHIYKGHFSGHGRRILQEYEKRIKKKHQEEKLKLNRIKRPNKTGQEGKQKLEDKNNQTPKNEEILRRGLV